MFGWLFRKRVENNLEEKTERGFIAVKKDMGGVVKWIKHLDERDKQLFDFVQEIQRDLSSIREDIEGLREGMELVQNGQKEEEVLRKTEALNKQTGVGGVVKGVQTGVQTGNFYEILRNLTAHERLVVFTLANSDMKLSYEDLALILGKERSTIRGQINAIKQKSGGLIQEISEKNGKKRVFVPEEVRIKLTKYAKVRVGRSKKTQKIEEKEHEN